MWSVPWPPPLRIHWVASEAGCFRRPLQVNYSLSGRVPEVNSFRRRCRWSWCTVKSETQWPHCEICDWFKGLILNYHCWWTLCASLKWISPFVHVIFIMTLHIAHIFLLGAQLRRWRTNVINWCFLIWSFHRRLREGYDFLTSSWVFYSLDHCSLIKIINRKHCT